MRHGVSFFRKSLLIGLSVDGTKEIHDSYRHTKDGKPTFDRIHHAAELMDRYGVEYNILTVVNQKVASNITEIYEFYKKQGWNYQQYIACLDPLDEAHGENEYALEPKQYGRFLIELLNYGMRTGRTEHSHISGNLKIMSVSFRVSAGSLRPTGNLWDPKCRGSRWKCVSM